MPLWLSILLVRMFTRLLRSIKNIARLVRRRRRPRNVPKLDMAESPMTVASAPPIWMPEPGSELRRLSTSSWRTRVRGEDSAIFISRQSTRNHQTTHTTLDRKLPAELLATICDLLGKSDVYRVWRVSKCFQRAASSAFGRNLDRRTFCLTCKEFDRLELCLRDNGCGGYMRTLRIDSGVACNCQRQTYVDWTNSQQATVSTLRWFRGYERVVDDKSECLVLLKRVVRWVPKVDKIVLSQQEGLTEWKLDRLGGWNHCPLTVEPFLASSRWAAWRTLDLLTRAFVWSVFERKVRLPRPTALSMQNPSPLESLPGLMMPVGNCVLFSTLARLKVTVADMAATFSQGWEVHKLSEYMPRFLRIVPSTLKDLTLVFPKEKNPLQLLQLGQQPSYGKGFGDVGFEALLIQDIRFPVLYNLHIANLSLADAKLLRKFLVKHAAGLRNLRFTSLALPVDDWKSFIHFFRTGMSLDRFVMNSNMNEEEREFQRMLWGSAPVDARPNLADYKGVAKETKVNGVKLDLEDPAPLIQEESGYEAEDEEG